MAETFTRLDGRELEPFIRGALEFVSVQGGLIQPRRFFSRQLKRYEKVGRTHRATSTAGVVIDFVTDGSRVSFDCLITRPLQADHSIYRSVMARHEPDTAMLAAEAGVVDGIDIEVAGRHLETLRPHDGTLSFAFENPSYARVEVRIYLPTIMSVAIGALEVDGSIEPAPARGYLLALGDSITQGFVAGHPSLTYPVRVAKDLDLEVINQGVAGYVFDKKTLAGLKPLTRITPEAIIVAYGTNDWAYLNSGKQIRKNMKDFFERLLKLFTDTPVYVLSPLWRVNEGESSPSGKSLAWIRKHLRRICDSHEQLHYIDGLAVMPANATLFADGEVHPGPEGMAYIAKALLEAIAASSVADVNSNQNKPATPKDLPRKPTPDIGKTAPHESLCAPAAPTPADLADAENAARVGSPGTHPEFDRLARTIWRLRQPDGCPWDKKQTHASMARYLIEEAYEAVEAIAQGDTTHLLEELGDVFEQVMLNAQIAQDDGEFTIDDVCRELNAKLVRRHPHVFGELAGTVNTEEEVLDVWNAEKRRERDGKDGAVKQGLLDSVPISLPALMQAQKISKRAAKAGFEWESTADVWNKVAEERAEFEAEASGSEAAALELGDLLFALVNVARHEGIDAEAALEASNRKFRRRWSEMEQMAAQDGRPLSDRTASELNKLWDAVKASEQSELQ